MKTTEQILAENRELKSIIDFINSEYRDCDADLLTQDALLLKVKALEVENAYLKSLLGFKNPARCKYCGEIYEKKPGTVCGHCGEGT